MDKNAIAELVMTQIAPTRPPELGITVREFHDTLLAQGNTVHRETARRKLDANTDLVGVTMLCEGREVIVYIHKDDMTDHYQLWKK